MRLIMFVVVGALLLLANIWYLRNIRRALATHTIPEVIAPVQFLGTADADGSRGRAMASMLATRIGARQAEIRAISTALSSSMNGKPPEGNLGVALPDLLEFHPEVSKTPEVKLEVSGVEIGGVLSWLVRSINEHRAIQVTMHYPESGDKCSVAAALFTDNVADVWIDSVQKDDAVIVNELAEEILRIHYLQNQPLPEISNLSRAEFRILIDVAGRITDFNNRAIRGSTVTQKEWEDALSKVQSLLTTTPRWAALLHLAGQMAEQTGNTVLAADYFQREAAILKRPAKGVPAPPQQLQKLDMRIAKVQKLITHNANIVAHEESMASPDAPTEFVSDYPASALGIPKDEPEGKRIVRVAVAGGIPTFAQLEELGMQNGLSSASDNLLGDHAGKIALLIRSIAPRTVFDFEPTASGIAGSFSPSEIVKNVAALAERHPDIIVMGFGIPVQQKPLFEKVFTDCRSKGIVVVIPTGNQDPTEQGKSEHCNLEFAELAIVVASIDREGRPAIFSNFPTAKNIFWAPGTYIPIPAPEHGPNQSTIGNGTSWSAALTTATIARMLSFTDKDALPPDQIRKTIEQSSVTSEQGLRLVHYPIQRTNP